MDKTVKKLSFHYFFIFLTFTIALEVLIFLLGMKSENDEFSEMIIFISILGLSTILGCFSFLFGVVTSFRNKKVFATILVSIAVPLAYFLVFNVMMSIYR